MRKFISNPVILILVVVVLASILLSGGKQVSWFSRFGLRTTKKHVSVEKNEYVQQKVDNSVIHDIISAHTILASNAIYGNLSKIATVSSIPQYIAATQRILMIDIVSYLENAPDKEAALDSLVWQMSYYQNQWWEIKSQLQEIIQTKNLDYKECASTKEEWDRNFYQWLREWDASVMVNWLDTSKKWGSCQSEAKIDINAHTVMLKRVTDLVATMNNISSLLTAQNQTIIGNFMLFKDTNLEKLLSLRNELRAKSPGTQ